MALYSFDSDSQGPDHDIAHIVVAIHHIHNKLLAHTLGHKEASVLTGVPQRVGGTENIALTCI